MRKLFALLFIAPVLGQNIPSYAPSYGLDTWYSFSNNTIDNSGNNHNGIPHNLTPAPGRSGQIDEGYYFNGQNSYIKINNPILNGQNKNKFAFYVSFKLDEIPISQSYPIWYKQFPQMNIELSISPGREIIFHYDNPDTVSFTWNSNNPLELDQWYDIVINFENSQFQIYINAIPVSTLHQAQYPGITWPIADDVADNCNFISNSFGSEIGKWATQRFKGIIDEFGIWNRPLKLCEIESLHLLEKQCIADTIGPHDIINDDVFINDTISEIIYDTVSLYDSLDVIDIVSDTIIITVYQDESMFYVPNAFTPDNNEHNQTWGPVAVNDFNPYEFELSIYNRWGEIMYKSNDLYSRWDGTYNSMKCPDGVYIWKITHRNNSNSEKLITLGNISLIR